MADRNDGFSESELEPPERKKVRGVVYREERRAWLLEGVGIWGKWLLGLPIGAVAMWSALQQIWKWVN
jgi:hypothetical protein